MQIFQSFFDLINPKEAMRYTKPKSEVFFKTSCICFAINCKNVIGTYVLTDANTLARIPIIRKENLSIPSRVLINNFSAFSFICQNLHIFYSKAVNRLLGVPHIMWWIAQGPTAKQRWRESKQS